MRGEMLKLMDGLARSIVILDALADKLAETAATLDDAAATAMLHEAARTNRILVLETQGRLAILHEEHAERFHTGSGTE